MKQINLIPNYQKNILENYHLESYKQAFPELFEDYFSYWADEKLFHKTIDNNQIKHRLELFNKVMIKIEINFSKHKINLSDITLVIMIGQGTASGHAFLSDSKPIVWIALEAYETEKQMEVFITHEIIHGLHYSKNPKLFYKNQKEKFHLGRQLITEGIATYLTMKILGINEMTALWADYLTKTELTKWQAEAKQKTSKLLDYSIKNWNLIDPSNVFFFANDKSNIMKYRGGYYIGLMLAQFIATQTNDLFSVSLNQSWLFMQQLAQNRL